jgi:NTP pyrophosphatase (non-canonical NTP hydrolase)
MQQNGLAKLIEEAGEVQQVAGKLIQYPELQLDEGAYHPDGTQLRRRLQDEMGDLIAACIFVSRKLKLDELCIDDRAQRKIALFNKWDKE